MDISTVLEHNNANVGTGAASGRTHHEGGDGRLIEESPEVDFKYQVELQKRSSTNIAAASSDVHSSAGGGAEPINLE